MHKFKTLTQIQNMLNFINYVNEVNEPIEYRPKHINPIFWTLYIKPRPYSGGAMPYRGVTTPYRAWLSHPPGYIKQNSQLPSSQCVVKRATVSISEVIIRN